MERWRRLVGMTPKKSPTPKPEPEPTPPKGQEQIAWWAEPSEGFSHFVLALISSDNKQVTKARSCKAYLEDTYGYHFNRKVDAHVNLSYNKNVCVNRIKIAFGSSGRRMHTDKMLDFIHQFEDILGIARKTIIKECNPPANFRKFYLAVGSRRWIRALPLVSLYTFLLRTARFHKVGANLSETLISIRRLGGNDRNTAHTILTNIEKLKKIIKNGERKVFKKRNINYPSQLPSHSAGIAGFGQGINKDGTTVSKRTRELCPHWYE